MKILETKRLWLRQMTKEDRGALAEILQDAEVMYAYAHPFSEEEVDQWMERQLQRYREDSRFGLWAMVRKDTGEMMGQCGLTWQNLNGRMVPEIGYLLRRDHWHQGYCIEAARACKAYAFDVLGLPQVFSIIRENNIPSMRVAVRNGMMPVEHTIKHYYGIEMPHIAFAVGQKEENHG